MYAKVYIDPSTHSGQGQVQNMPITRSAKKALRQNKRRRVQNLSRANKIKSLTKELRKALVAKNLEKAKALMPEIYQALDKAAKQNVITKNAASRKKSRLTKSLTRAKTQTGAKAPTAKA